MKRILALFLVLLASFSLVSCVSVNLDFEDAINVIDEVVKVIEDKEVNIEENGKYTTKEDVALYIHTYDKLPSNFIKKKDANELGWESSKGNLWDVTDKMSIGGDKFGNREKLLPIKNGRVYYECDINYEGEYRGAERIVYSNDALVYYTKDHYETFTLLYGDENL